MVPFDSNRLPFPVDRIDLSGDALHSVAFLLVAALRQCAHGTRETRRRPRQSPSTRAPIHCVFAGHVARFPLRIFISFNARTGVAIVPASLAVFSLHGYSVKTPENV
jgi:hypothetical protein